MSIEQLIKSGAIAPGSTRWEVNSPTQALVMLRNIFKGHCTVDNATVCAIIERGYQTAMAPPATPMPGSIPYPNAMPPILPSTSASEALDILYREAGVKGRHYLPCDWLRTLAQGRMAASQAQQLTPAQLVADDLLAAAIKYLDLARSGDAGHILDGQEIEDLELIVEPLRPLPPPTLEEAMEVLRRLTRTDGGSNHKAFEDAQALVNRAK